VATSELAGILVDSNVLLDIATEDSHWMTWSAEQLERLAERYALIINPLVYSEISVGFDRIEDLDAAVPPRLFRPEPLPWPAAFLAGKAFLTYRREGGTKKTPLPDFYIGAHATLQGYGLLTRDARRYRSYFPQLAVIGPD
jgi:predicted nucleic acid-binding protein